RDSAGSETTIDLSDGPHPGVRLLTINRPDRMNAIGAKEAVGLTSAMKVFDEDDSAHVLVITGAGTEAFCAGADLRAVAAMFSPDAETEPLFSTDQADPRSPIDGNIGPTRRTGIHKPVIAAVNGAAYAGGLEWACFAHIRIADQHASFGVTCRRWNVGLGDGGTQRLPRLVGLGRALELIITGRVIGAGEAERIGLVNEVTPSGHCLERALKLAGQIASLPQPALRTDLEATMRGFGRPLEEGLAVEAECFDRLLSSPELRLGATQFVERDHPDRVQGAPPLYLPGKAYAFAESAHRGKLDRYGLGDFIDHPVGVAQLVGVFDDPEIEAAAYLHDTVEKTDVTPELIEAEFGPKILGLVMNLSQDPRIDDSAGRREEHRQRMREVGWKAQAIYASDRIDGMRRMSELLESGVDAASIEAPRRIAAWKDDFEVIRDMDIPSELLATLTEEILRLERLTDPT
ncbi:MAG: enoyl-CoA hydratase-related protein, partial [Solirubrobacterales bacterium]